MQAAAAKQTTKLRSKRWLLTCNNPGDRTPIWNPLTMNYMVWQNEVGGQTGTPHWHCYVRYKERQTRASIKRGQNGLVCDMRPAMGSEGDCRAYCTKPETRSAPGEEFGEYCPSIGEKGKGQRCDLLMIADYCKKGKTLKKIALKFPKAMIRYHSGIAALHAHTAPMPPAIRTVKVLLLWGPTGTGKSYRVSTQMPEAYKVMPGRDPWGNYRGEDTIWFDEFDHKKWDIFQMNMYLDGYRCKLDRRYTDAYAAWTQVVICANSSPTTWYPDNTPAEVNAFRRRLGTGCRRVLDRLVDISTLEPNPDFGYLVPPPIDPDNPVDAAAAAPQADENAPPPTIPQTPQDTPPSPCETLWANI